jgi:hypothetical protein
VISLKPITSPLPEEVPFAVFDIEAEPSREDEPLNTKFLAAGIFDGSRYVEVSSVSGLLDVLLSDRYEGYWIYAHNGSGYDFLFLMHELNRRKANFRAFRTGGRFFLSVEGRELLDSACILRGSLEEIGESLGLQKRKLDKPEDFFKRIRFYWPTLGREYMRRDCETLYEAITVIRDACRRLGCSLRPTLASTSMDLYRRRYLADPIPGQPWYSPTELAARQAYSGGRVENFTRLMRKGGCWDLNSCYPRAMQDPVPAELKRTYVNSGHVLPDFGVAKATVKIPPDEWVPPLAFKANTGKLLFPTGEWEQWFTTLELRRVIERYGKSAVNVTEAHEYIGRPLFKAFIDSLYAVRQQAKDRGDHVMAYACKILMNSFYGKLGTNREREKLVFGPEYYGYPYDNPKELARLERMKRQGFRASVKEYSEEHFIYGVPVFLEHAPYIFPATAAWITAHARIEQLYPLLVSAGKSLVYCDTDSIYRECDNPQELYLDQIGDDLGDLKLEAEIARGEFVAPKCYWYEVTDGQYQRDKAKSKTPDKVDRFHGAAKGLPRKSLEAVKSYLAGEAVKVPRMLGTFESLARRGKIEPVSELQPKQMRTVDDKRHPEGRAWTMTELQKRGLV